MTTIFPIVEGHGEITAVPLLLRRILNERFGRSDCFVSNPYRLPRSKIALLGNDLLTAIRLGEAKVRADDGCGGIIVIADADDDCPAELYARFISFIANNHFTLPISFVLAKREYEAWMIACGEQMRDHEWVRDDAPSHPDPENIRGAKGYFERFILLDGKTYSETVDQAKFSAQINLEVTSGACRSFRKLLAEVAKLV